MVLGDIIIGDSVWVKTSLLPVSSEGADLLDRLVNPHHVSPFYSGTEGPGYSTHRRQSVDEPCTSSDMERTQSLSPAATENGPICVEVLLAQRFEDGERGRNRTYNLLIKSQ